MKTGKDSGATGNFYSCLKVQAQSCGSRMPFHIREGLMAKSLCPPLLGSRTAHVSAVSHAFETGQIMHAATPFFATHPHQSEREVHEVVS